MSSDFTLKQLKEKVAKARKVQEIRTEKKKLRQQLFELENPGFQTFKTGFISGAKAFGRGAVGTARGIQRYAAEREKDGRISKQTKPYFKVKRKHFKPTQKTRTIPVIRGGQVVSFREVPVQRIAYKKPKKKKKMFEPSRMDNFSLLSSLEI